MTDRMNIYIYSKLDEESLEKKGYVQEALIAEGFTISCRHEDANIIISLGSDGTFLQAVRHTGYRQDCLYAGISILDKPGFYCDFHFKDVADIVPLIRNAKIQVRHYPIIEVKVDDQQPFYCLNEFTVRSNIIRMFTVDVVIDDTHFETFLGDGIIVSTPTGSTAYNKSVNGAIIDPLIPCFQVTELASVNTNTFRTIGSPFVLSGSRKLSLRVHQDGNDFPSMAADNEALGIRKVESIDIQLSDKKIKTVKLKDNSFFEKVARIYL